MNKAFGLMVGVTLVALGAMAEGVTQAGIEAKADRYAELKKAAKNRETDETRALMKEIYADQAAFFAARAGLDDAAWLKEGNPFRYNGKMNGFLRTTEEGRRVAAAAGDRILALPAWGGEGRKAKKSLGDAANCVLGSKDPVLRSKAAGYLRQRADIAKAEGDCKRYAWSLDQLAMTLLKDWLDRPAAIAAYREGFKDAALPEAERARFEAMIWQLED